MQSIASVGTPTVVVGWGLLAAAVSLAVCGLIVLTKRWHGELSLDSDLDGAQKFHSVPVPRVGGVGLLAGLTVASAGLLWQSDGHQAVPLALLLCALPAFAAGFTEDLTKRVTARTRLLATFASAALAAWLLDAVLVRLDVPLVDEWMTWAPLGIAFTCFAVGGLANGINIIDGFNGLASGSVMLMLAALGGIAWRVEDALVLQLALVGIGAMAGFWVLNYPFGKLFLGDGGAYLAGFWLAECAVLLLVRNPGVSTWAPLLACFYPVWETLFSIYRKELVSGIGCGRPDQLHLHMLLYGGATRVLPGHLRGRPWARHGLTSLLLWCCVTVCGAVAVVLHASTPWLMLGFTCMAACYQLSYRVAGHPRLDAAAGRSIAAQARHAPRMPSHPSDFRKQATRNDATECL